MDADASRATQDYSSRATAIRVPQAPGTRSRPPLSSVRVLLALIALTGAFLLVLSTFTTIVEIRVLTTSDLAGQDTQISGRDLHGIALILVALVALVMLAGALRGARPAMAALAATGLLAIGLVVGFDVPELDNAGPVAQLYENVSAGAARGFYYETLGGVLLLLAGGGLWLVGAGRERGLTRSAAGPPPPGPGRTRAPAAPRPRDPPAR